MGGLTCYLPISVFCTNLLSFIAESEQSLPDQFAAVTISSGSTNYRSSEVLHNNLHNDLQDNPQDDPHDINEPDPPYHQINTDNHMYNHTDDLTDNHDNQITETTDMVLIVVKI